MILMMTVNVGSSYGGRRTRYGETLEPLSQVLPEDHLDASRPVWKSTSASGALTRPCWLRRAVRNRHRHAIEQERAVKF